MKKIIILCITISIFLCACTSENVVSEVLEYSEQAIDDEKIETDEYVKEKLADIEEMSRTDRLYNALYHLESGEYKVSYNFFKYLYNEYEKESLDINNELYSWDTAYVESEMALCYLFVSNHEKALAYAKNAWDQAQVLKERAINGTETIAEFDYENVINVYGAVLYQHCLANRYEDAENVVNILEELKTEDIDIYTSGILEMQAHLYKYSDKVYSEEKVIECYNEIIEGSEDDGLVLRTEYKKIIALYEFGMKDEADTYYDEVITKIPEGKNRELVTILKLISDEELEEAKKKINKLEQKKVVSENDPDIYRLRLSIAEAENDEANILVYINKIVDLTRVEVYTKQYKDYEERYDLDFSEVRLSLEEEKEENNRIELDIEM
jgi:outer membrane lipoprotein-sorting protein